MKFVIGNLLPLLLIAGYNYLCLASYETPHVIGALFNVMNSQAILPLESIVYQRNTIHEVPYTYIYRIVSDSDSFAASKMLCNMTETEDIAGVFGPPSLTTSATLQSICAHFEIPYILTSWRPPTVETPNTVVNLFPEATLFAQGLATVVQELHWNSFAVIYENEEGLVRMQEMLKLHEYKKDSKSNDITVYKLGPGPDYRSLLKKIKDLQIYNIILDCDTENIISVLEQAQHVNLLDIHHSVFLTSLDAHTLDYTDLKATSNITTIRLIYDPENDDVKRVVQNWNMNMNMNMNSKFSNPVSSGEMKTETALMYDAVLLFTDAINTLTVTDPIVSHPINCSDSERKSTHGLAIASYMKKDGKPKNYLTGSVRFDDSGNRIQFNLYLVEIKIDKNEQTAKTVIANWTTDDPSTVIRTRTETENVQAAVESLQKVTVIVSSRIGKPYLFEDKTPGLEGNQRYYGYSMDLIGRIAQNLNFTFEFRITKNNEYGNLINDLLERRAHLAICDLTITHKRRELVDFSMPFMNLGISILYRKPSKKEVDMFAFLNPFSISVWIYTATLYLIVSIILYFIARMAPDDWENPHLCDENPDELENIWDIKNCFWLTLGSIMTQGCDILPKGISSRMATSMWWFFSLIMTSSYTANLAAFLTMERMEPTIDSAEALSKQTKIKYGAVTNGSTQAFFRESNYSTYQRMWINMESSKPSVFEKNNDKGVERVLHQKNGLYAFLMESTQIEYEIETKCDLKQVGGWLDSKGYGIAMPMNSAYRSAINKAVLGLQEDGTLSKLKTKWWKEKRDEASCDNTSSEGGSSNELALANVGGVFLVLGVGVGIAFFLAILEFLWNVRNISVEEHLTFWDAFKAEVKFASNVWITKKRTKPIISESTSKSSSRRSSRSSRSRNRSLARIIHGASSFLNLENAANKIDSRLNLNE